MITIRIMKHHTARWPETQPISGNTALGQICAARGEDSGCTAVGIDGRETGGAGRQRRLRRWLQHEMPITAASGGGTWPAGGADRHRKSRPAETFAVDSMGEASILAGGDGGDIHGHWRWPRATTMVAGGIGSGWHLLEPAAVAGEGGSGYAR